MQVYGCGSCYGTGGIGGTGGVTATGGVTETGGATETGGVRETGGVTATGGARETGGVMETGGEGGIRGGGGVIETGGGAGGEGGGGPDLEALCTAWCTVLADNSSIDCPDEGYCMALCGNETTDLDLCPAEFTAYLECAADNAVPGSDYSCVTGNFFDMATPDTSSACRAEFCDYDVCWNFEAAWCDETGAGGAGW